MRAEAHIHGVSTHRLINISEVAELLGVEVRHVRRLVAERRIPFIKWGHLLRFDPAEIDAWIDNARVAARPNDGGAQLHGTMDLLPRSGRAGVPSQDGRQRG